MATAATDAAIHKKMFGSGCPSDLAQCTTTITVSNEEMNDIMRKLSLLKNLVY